jgi:hypothetical protein
MSLYYHDRKGRGIQHCECGGELDTTDLAATLRMCFGFFRMDADVSCIMRGADHQTRALCDAMSAAGIMQFSPYHRVVGCGWYFSSQGKASNHFLLALWLFHATRCVGSEWRDKGSRLWHCSATKPVPLAFLVFESMFAFDTASRTCTRTWI